MFRYSHLQEIINKILLEKPKNPLKSFEFYSQILKRSYIPRENYFEPVYVDHINRDDCRKNLEMYEVSKVCYLSFEKKTIIEN